MIAKPQLFIELHDGMMSSPTLNRFQNPASICEWTERTVANSVDDVMRITGTVAEIVFVTLLMHPSRFEESLVVVASVDWFAICVVDDQLLDWAIEGQHVFRQLGNSWQ